MRNPSAKKRNSRPTSGFLVAASVSSMALPFCFSTTSLLVCPRWLGWLDRLALVRPKRVTQRQPIGTQQCPRRAGVVHQGEHEHEGGRKSDEQHAAPARQHPRPEGGYAQERETRKQPDSRRNLERSEERRVGKECRSRWSPYH